MLLTPLSVLAGLLGCLMGFLYAVSGFSDPGKVDSLADNPRVKNLVWVLGGAATVFFVDWKVMSPDTLDAAEKGRLVAAYGVCALAMAGIVLLAMSLSILLDVAAAARREDALSGRAVDLVQEYLAYGFRAYRARRSELERDGALGLSTPDALAEYGSAMSVLLGATLRERQHPAPARRDELIDSALLGIEYTVKLFTSTASDLVLESNYMALVSADGLAGTRVLFASRSPEEEAEFLVLRRYRSRPAAPIALPVARPGEREHLLPGAPTAAREGVACLLNARNIVFNAGVPPVIQAEIKAFFESTPYRSVLSFPLQYEKRIVGVVNVESNLVDLGGKGPDMIREIGSAIAPYGIILGELVDREEG